ncbi:MAG TPA: TRAP transporter fused permease subunit [Burkholderiaceae bacterium]
MSGPDHRETFADQVARTARVPRPGLVVTLFGVVTVGFHLYLVFSGLIPNLITRPVHYLLALPWIFVFTPSGSSAARVFGWACAALGAACAAYVAVFSDSLADQYGILEGPLQIAIGLVLVAVALEMARRAINWVLPAITTLVLAYGMFGHLVPGTFGHDPFALDSFLGDLVISESGLWSELTGLSADTIAPFLILGAFISAGAAGSGFMSLSTQIAGRFRAGAAKVAVLSSAMYGTISGSASANTASTGMVTIPAMKRMGYPPSLAAATEAVASTGGQIMPPLMGAGIFVMAELLALPYTTIMVAATPAAILFFVTAWVGVHQYAIKFDLEGMAADELPGWVRVARTLPFFAVPFAILIYVLGWTAYTPQYAALFATAATVLLLAFDATGRSNPGGWLARLQVAVVDAGRQIATIAAILICAGLITGVFHKTGVGVKITSLILSASDGSLWVGLALTGLASLLLGMELPTTAAYVICIAVAGDALQSMGLTPLYAHLFVFWYALLCTITPPVCGNVFIAAGIAQTPWLPVAGRSMLLGVGLFVLPMGFIANPWLLKLATDPAMALVAGAKVGLGVWMISVALIRPMRWRWLRPLLLCAGAATIFFDAYGWDDAARTALFRF